MYNTISATRPRAAYNKNSSKMTLLFFPLKESIPLNKGRMLQSSLFPYWSADLWRKNTLFPQALREKDLVFPPEQKYRHTNAHEDIIKLQTLAWCLIASYNNCLPEGLSKSPTIQKVTGLIKESSVEKENNILSWREESTFYVSILLLSQIISENHAKNKKITSLIKIQSKSSETDSRRKQYLPHGLIIN